MNTSPQEGELCCKICEKNFRFSLFEDHIDRCKERAEQYELFLASKSLIIEYVQRAHHIRTKLNTNVKLQKNTSMKKSSKKKPKEAIKIPDNDHSELDQTFKLIEKNESNPYSSEFENSGQKEMYEEEFSNSMKILKRIIQYGSFMRKNEDSITYSELKDDLSMKNEIKFISSKIRDSIIQLFLKDFNTALKNFISNKKRYIIKLREVESLIGSTPDLDDLIKTEESSSNLTTPKLESTSIVKQPIQLNSITVDSSKDTEISVPNMRSPQNQNWRRVMKGSSMIYVIDSKRKKLLELYNDERDRDKDLLALTHVPSESSERSDFDETEKKFIFPKANSKPLSDAFTDDTDDSKSKQESKPESNKLYIDLGKRKIQTLNLNLNFKIEEDESNMDSAKRSSDEMASEETKNNWETIDALMNTKKNLLKLQHQDSGKLSPNPKKYLLCLFLHQRPKQGFAKTFSINFDESQEADQELATTRNKSRHAEDDEIFSNLDIHKGYYSDSAGLDVTKFKIDSYSIILLFIISEEISIHDFEFIKFIGQGAYGRIFLVRKKQTGDLYALKIIDFLLNELDFDNLNSEKDIYKIVDGEYIVKAIWTFRYINYICFVLEYMVGGDMSQLIRSSGRLEEDVARNYFAELILAVEFLHSINIVHKDLKPENLLLDSRGHLKLTDFGLSEQGIKQQQRFNIRKSSLEEISITETAKEKIFCFLEKEDEAPWIKPSNISKKSIEEIPSPTRSPSKRTFHKLVGTPDYIAPELILGEDFNNRTLDFWSMGIILYEFLVGIPPFNDDSVEKIYQNILSNKIDWDPFGEGDVVSPAARDLIKSLLNSNPKKRLGSVNGSEDIKKHPFFRDIDWENLRDMEAPIIPSTEDEYFVMKDESLTLDSIFGSAANLNMARHSACVVDFKMKRIDLLYHLNKKSADEYRKKKFNEEF